MVVHNSISTWNQQPLISVVCLNWMLYVVKNEGIAVTGCRCTKIKVGKYSKMWLISLKAGKTSRVWIPSRVFPSVGGSYIPSTDGARFQVKTYYALKPGENIISVQNQSPTWARHWNRRAGTLKSPMVATIITVQKEPKSTYIPMCYSALENPNG